MSEIVVCSPEELTSHWGGDQNFLISPKFWRFDVAFPPVEEVVDHVRKDNGAHIRIDGDHDEAEKAELIQRFRTGPIDEVIDYPFRLGHYHLSQFYGPDYWRVSGRESAESLQPPRESSGNGTVPFLRDLQDKVMNPWRGFLSSLGFTWQRCHPIIFISGKGCGSGYHVDVSHVVAWQVWGTKVFNGFRNPERYAPLEQCVKAKNSLRREKPPDHPDEDLVRCEMNPGDLLWNQILTPHWVDATKDEVAMSLNIAHGGLRYRGAFCPREARLREHWAEHPEEAKLTNLRY
jgi:hypothetical protein